jgi:(p)ppGpp synthase/HD superfamily hydrolase
MEIARKYGCNMEIWKKTQNMEKYGKYGQKSLWIYKQNKLKMRFSCISDLPESREKIWISI